MKNKILCSSFVVSDAAAEKVGFGGYIDRVDFPGEVIAFKKWDDVCVFSGQVKPSDTEILLGYVVYNDDLDKVVSFEYEEYLACKSASELAETEGHEYSVGSVILKKYTFIMRTTEPEEIED